MGTLGDREGEQPAALQTRDGLLLQSFVAAHQDGEQTEERDLQTVAVRRAEVRDRLREAGELEQVELMSPRRVCLRRQDARVEAVLRLIVDPVWIPRLLAVLLLEHVKPLAGEEISD